MRASDPPVSYLVGTQGEIDRDGKRPVGTQLVDVHLPTTDGRTVILTHHTQPEKDCKS